MAKNYALLTGRRPVRDNLGALLVAVVVLVLWGGCSTGRGSTSLRPSLGQQQLTASFETAGGMSGIPAQTGEASPVAQEDHGPEETRCGPAPGPVRDMVTWERLCRATVRAASRLPEHTARHLLATVTPHRLLTLHTLSSHRRERPPRKDAGPRGGGQRDG